MHKSEIALSCHIDGLWCCMSAEERLNIEGISSFLVDFFEANIRNNSMCEANVGRNGEETVD